MDAAGGPAVMNPTASQVNRNEMGDCKSASEIKSAGCDGFFFSFFFSEVRKTAFHSTSQFSSSGFGY